LGIAANHRRLLSKTIGAPIADHSFSRNHATAIQPRRSEQMPTTTTQPDFAALLATATTDPGTISAAYSAFHNYSLGNIMLAMIQCHARGISLGPLASFNRWKELGRYVRKGEKAIELCMPITCKRTIETTDASGDTVNDDATFTRFVFRRNWFVLSQTDGNPYAPPQPPHGIRHAPSLP
jgi:hypothetical protein